MAGSIAGTFPPSLYSKDTLTIALRQALFPEIQRGVDDGYPGGIVDNPYAGEGDGTSTVVCQPVKLHCSAT